MNNLSEEDSFAASNIDDEDFPPEESIVNQGRTKTKTQKSHKEVKVNKSPQKKEEKQEKMKINLRRNDKTPPKFVKEPSPKKERDSLNSKKMDSTTSTQER